MCLQTNVVKRGGSARYYARISVPNDLRDIVGKRELWKSLGTADPRLARERAAPQLALWHAEFADLRRKRAPTEDDLQRAVWQHYQREIEIDRIERANRAPTYPEARRVYEAELRKHVATGEPALLEWSADEVIQRDGLLIKKGSAEYHDLVQRLQRAQLEALRRQAERDEGNFAGKPADELVAPPEPTAAVEIAKPGETIMALYDRFAREKAGSARPDTWAQNRKIVQLFADFVGEGAGAAAITRKNLRDWKQALANWPIKAVERRAFKGKSFREIVAANIGLGLPTIIPKTINKYVSAVGAFGRWLRANDYVVEDISAGMYLDVDKRARPRGPFTSEQLAALVASPLFTGFQADGKEHLAGNVTTRDWRFWIPLVALYSGARLGEIAQLHVKDVHELHGHWVFDFNDHGDKHLKTAGSARIVPVHPELLRLGFIDHVASAKSGRLFPELKANARGFLSAGASDFVNGYLARIGVKSDRSLSAHSFRHTFTDALRRGGFLDAEIGILLGHGTTSMTSRYGALPPGTLKQRVAMIEAIEYPGVDLAALYSRNATAAHRTR